MRGLLIIWSMVLMLLLATSCGKSIKEYSGTVCEIEETNFSLITILMSDLKNGHMYLIDSSCGGYPTSPVMVLTNSGDLMSEEDNVIVTGVKIGSARGSYFNADGVKTTVKIPILDLTSYKIH